MPSSTTCTTRGGDANSNASGTSESDPTTFLKESDDTRRSKPSSGVQHHEFCPELNIHADVNCASESVDSSSCKASGVPIVGTWFAKTLHMDSGESTVAGMNGMRSWWKLDGSWPKDDSAQG